MKRFKKYLCVLLALCMLMSMLPVSVFAETTEIASGTCGSNLTWTLDDAGTLTISGTGSMVSWTRSSAVPWYGRFVKSVIIADGVTSIGAYAFNECTSLVTVTIGKGVTTIGKNAFRDCTSLIGIEISDSVTSVSSCAFYGCSSLTNIEIPDSVTSIGEEAFRCCDSLTSVTIGNSVTRIGNCAFYDCSSLTSLIIGNSVTSIGKSAFCSCSSLTSVTIPDSVTSIGEFAFNDCSSLTSVTIGNGVTSIGTFAFDGCTKLTSVIIPNSVTNIGYYAFRDCTRLTSVIIPDSVTSIGEYAFYGCSSLTSVIIPNSVTIIRDSAFLCCDSLSSVTVGNSVTWIGDRAFSHCTSLREITFCGDAPSIGDYMFYGVKATSYYPADNKTWTSDIMQDYGGNITWVPYGSNNDAPGTEGESSLLEIAGLSIDKMHESFYIFLGDSRVYNMDSPNAELYLELNQIAVVDNDVISPADIVWTSSDETVLRIVSSGTEEDPYVNLRVEGLAEGTATLTATNPAGETLSFDVTVVKPNTLAFTNIYDTKQYYSSGAFYSAASSISDSVEIFVQFENALIDGYPCKVESDLAKNVSVVEPITLTATVSGSDLSFDRNSYQNTYTTTYDPIKFGNCVYDILMLFPYDIDSFNAGASYTVKLTLESDSFAEPIEETYSFTVYDAEKQRVAEHINFTNNSAYKVSKQNIYGTNMLELKGDDEYQWSKWTSFDFDNYYEVVLADILVGMLDVYQVNTSIVPAVLKEWHGTYKSLLGDVTTMVEESYSDVLDVSEMKIDKILKVSKYTNAGDGIYADDDVYQVVLDMFGNVGNVDKIQTFFAAVDDTKSAFSIVKLTGDVVKDFVAWGNSIAVLNAFVETDENFKQVFRQVANNIPDSEKKMKEAIEDYLNYSEDFAGQFAEIYDSFCDLGVDVALDTFDGIVGEKLWDWAAAKAVGWIGKIPISGGTATFSSTTAYASLTTAIGSVTTGISLGLCLSDLICDSSDKAAEMSKIIAMSEYAPYIIQALEYYENNLSVAGSNDAVDLFENAFNLHKAAQSYIMEHTVKALEVKGESILYTILGNDDYDKIVAEILAQKNAIDSMECCGHFAGDTIVYTTKVVAIKCPVDVYLYNKNGDEVVRIINDVLEYAADGLCVYVRDGEKYIALSANQAYSVKIIATDNGSMEYIVMEFDKQLRLDRTLRKESIALTEGRIFFGEVINQLGADATEYTLTFDKTTIELEVVETSTEDEHDDGPVDSDNAIPQKSFALFAVIGAAIIGLFSVFVGVYIFRKRTKKAKQN